VMVVNCASYCVYTPEYTPLKVLDSIYGTHYNFTVIGFPSDDFLHQGGTDSAIIATCHEYDVNFPIMAKVSIVTGDTAPIYKWLQREDLNGVSNATVSWNFNKFLIDRQGHWVRWIDSPVSPLDTSIINWIVDDSAAVAAGVQTVNTDEFVHLKSANPASSGINLEIKTSGAQQFNINMYSVEGKLIGNIYNGIISSTQQINYAVGSLSSGIYLIKAQTTTGEQTLKCVIAH
jgi:glutathione peroxidase-family protein